MNHSIQLSELNGLRRTNSDGNLLLMKNEVNKKSYSEIIEEYNLEVPEVNYVRKGDIHNSFSLFLLKLFNYIDNLYNQIDNLKEHIQSFSTQQLVYEDQNTILSRQLNRRRNDIKKLNMQLINCEQHVDHYRSLFNKYNISDTSIIERLTSANRSLQEEYQIQQKKIYSLEQQLFSLEKEKDQLVHKNKLLYDTISSKDDLSLTHEERKTIEVAKKKKKSKGWFSSLFHSSHKKNKQNVIKEGGYEPVLNKPRISSSLTDESSLSMNSMPLLKEDIHMLRRSSTHSRNSSDGMTSSHSTSCLVGIGNESIQKRVSKVMKNRTRSEHVASQDSTSATSESTCCIKRDNSNDSYFAIQI